RLVRYFYHRACKDGCDKDVAEEAFHYPGPRPQTKEAAIVMLADSVEAAVRSADDHSAENISRMITKIIDDTLVEGQLNECDLSLRDLDKIKEAFVSVMQGIFHPRVKYPDSEIEAPPAAIPGTPPALGEPAASSPTGGPK
ncbi:MAG: hypothetical protein ACYC1C_14605, partial [Chloroflexota bacterium]